MMKKILIIVGLSLFLTLQGCSVFSPIKTPEINTYTLSDNIYSNKKTPHSNAILMVSTPTANPGLDSEYMIYSKKPHQLEKFAYNQWVAPPAEILAPLLTKSIESTTCFGTVVPSPTSSSADYNLQTRITSFEQHFNENYSFVTVGLNVILTHNETGKMQQQRFEVSVPAAQSTPYAGVIAINKAVDRLLKRINGFVCMSSNS